MKPDKEYKIKIWSGTLIAFIAVLIITPETILQTYKESLDVSFSNMIIQWIKIPLGCFFASAVINGLFESVFKH